MKRKIFSITLAILLILSSLSGLTAFAETTATEVLADAATTISANSYSAQSGAEWNGTYLKLAYGKSATYTVSVPAGKSYDIKVNLFINDKGVTNAGYASYIKVYLDESTTYEKGLYTGKISSEETSKLGTIQLSEGEHTIKIENYAGERACLQSITLEPYEADVSFGTPTTIGARLYSTQKKTSWNSTGGYLKMEYGSYAIYDVNVPAGSRYDIKVDLANISGFNQGYQAYFKVYLDGNTAYENKLYTGLVSSDALSTLGTIHLLEGKHTIKVENYAGSGACLKSITLNLADSAYLNSDKNEFGIGYRASSKHMAIYGDNSTSGDYISTEGLIQLAGGSSEVVYNVYAPAAGKYLLSTYVGNKTNVPEFSVTINGTRVATGVKTVQTSGWFYAAKGSLAVITLSQGQNTIKLNSTGGGGYFFGICLEAAADAAITLYEGGLESTTEATGITDGTMSVKVDLNGTTEEGKDALVIFAIYESDGTEFTRLHGSVVIPVAAANLGETAQGSITGISQVPGCSYTAKVFIWDATTITGDVVSFFN